MLIVFFYLLPVELLPVITGAAFFILGVVQNFSRHQVVLVHKLAKIFTIRVSLQKVSVAWLSKFENTEFTHRK